VILCEHISAVCVFELCVLNVQMEWLVGLLHLSLAASSQLVQNSAMKLDQVVITFCSTNGLDRCCDVRALLIVTQ